MDVREPSAWQVQVTSLPVDQLVETLALAGFEGIFVNRHGYPDMAAKLEAELNASLLVQPIVSSDSRLSFFPMARYNAGLRQRYSIQEWEEKRDRILHPALLAGIWDGFYALGREEDTYVRWCEANGEMFLSNTGSRAQDVTLTVRFQTGDPNPARVRLDSPLFSAEAEIVDQRGSLTQRMTVPPRRHRITVACKARSCNGPGELRTLVFGIADWKVTNAEGP